MNKFDLKIPKGSYVVAVSGGVDSVVLLNLLTEIPGLGLIVAHFDHGIRYNSTEDRLLVERIAAENNLPFVYAEGKLGKKVSEDTARRARYDFLHKVLASTNSKAIITAHHQDDLLETAIFNISRGTGRKGLTSLTSTPTILRPLIGIPKEDLYDYAKERGLVWHEDPTNQDTAISRNYIRHNVIPKLGKEGREKLLNIITQTAQINGEIDDQFMAILNDEIEPEKMDRQMFIMMPHLVAKETMASWLRKNKINDFDAKLIDKLTIAAKTYKNGQCTDVNAAYYLKISKGQLALTKRDR